MRTQQVHIAIAQGNSRFEICRLTSKGVHITHKRGERLEDCISHVLGMLRRAESGPDFQTSLDV